MSLIAAVLKLGYAGLVATDLGIHITALANEGAGIYREIPDRRQALVQIQNDFENLQKDFDGRMIETANLSAAVNQSLNANNLIYLDLDGVFTALTSLQNQFEKLGLSDPLKPGKLQYASLSPTERKAVDYIVPAVGTAFFTGDLALYMRSMYRGTTRVDNMVRGMNDIRLWKNLTSAQQSMLTAKKFGIKNPVRVSRYTVLKSALAYSGMAAVSIASITYMAVKEREELEELNAAIAGVEKNIQILKGNITPNESDFHGEISPEISDYIYSFPRLEAHNSTLKTFEADDLKNFMTVIDFFRDIYHGAESDKLKTWRESISLGESGSPGDSLFEGLYSLVYYPKGNTFFSKQECFSQNDWQLQFDEQGRELVYPYGMTDMRCIQSKLHDFFASVGVSVLRLALDIAPNVPSPPELTEKKRQDIISVCTNRVYKTLKPEAIRALIKRTKFVTDAEIDQVLRENLNGQCPVPA